MHGYRLPEEIRVSTLFFFSAGSRKQVSTDHSSAVRCEILPGALTRRLWKAPTTLQLSAFATVAGFQKKEME
jgi:hypothetical protein